MAKPDRIFASELLEREVMDLRAGEIVGAVTDFNVTREGVVTQLGVLPLHWYRGGWGIAPGAVTNVTRERVSIEDSTLLEDFNPDGEESLSAMLGDNVYGKAVLQADGELLGHLADFAFDLSDGQITDVVVFGDDDKRTRISVESVQTIGRSYVVINRAGGGVEVEPGPKKAASSARSGAAAAYDDEVDVLDDDGVETGDDYGPHTVEYDLDETADADEYDDTAGPRTAPAAAEISGGTAPALPDADEASGGAALMPEPMMEAPAPPIVEEIGVPIAAESEQTPAVKGRTPARPKTPTGRSSVASGEKATGRRSGVDGEKATGRSSHPDTEKATGRSSKPRAAGTRRSEQQMELGAEVEAPSPVAESLEGLGLSTFDLRKAQYLAGKAAHRDIRGGDGKLILTRGTPFNRGRIAALVEQGLLNSVFLEMTQHKG